MIAAPTAHVITMMPAPSHLPRQARNATMATVPQGITKRPAPRGTATASAVLRTVPKTKRQPQMPSEYSEAPTTGPNPRIVARQGAKIAPPKTVRTAATTRLSVRSTLAGWPSVVTKPSSPGSRIPPPRTRPAQTMIFLPFDRLVSGASVSPAHAGVNTALTGAPITAGVNTEPSGAAIAAGVNTEPSGAPITAGVNGASGGSLGLGSSTPAGNHEGCAASCTDCAADVAALSKSVGCHAWPSHQ